MRRRPFNGPLREADKEPAAGGLTEAQVSAVVAAQMKPFAEMLGKLGPVLEKLGTPEPKPEVKTPPVDEPAVDEKDLPPSVKAQLQASDRLIKALEAKVKAQEDRASAADERAEKAARTSELQAVLADDAFNFLEGARETVFEALLPKVARAKDGTLVIGELPVKDAVKQQLETKYAFALKAERIPGTGASAGVGAGGNARIKLDDIKAGMTAEQKGQTWAALGSILQGR